MFYFFFYTALVLLSSCSHRHAHDRETSTLQEISPKNTKQNQPDPKPVEDLRGIHFLLLRAQEALTLNRAENAQRELDSAFSFLSKLEANKPIKKPI